jgi:hypothetical protein
MASNVLLPHRCAGLLPRETLRPTRAHPKLEKPVLKYESHRSCFADVVN